MEETQLKLIDQNVKVMKTLIQFQISFEIQKLHQQIQFFIHMRGSCHLDRLNVEIGVECNVYLLFCVFMD